MLMTGTVLVLTPSPPRRTDPVDMVHDRTGLGQHELEADTEAAKVTKCPVADAEHRCV